MSFLSRLDALNFTPHGVCLLWNPGLLWLHAGADAAIALAYFSIPIVLLILVRRRADLGINWVLWLFAAFILACGTAHILAIATLWVPVYWLEGTVKLLTAALSVATAMALWPMIPWVMGVPSTETMRRAQQRLREMERVSAEANRWLLLAEQVAHVGHWRVDLPSFKVFWSDEIYRIHGRTKDPYNPAVDRNIGTYHPDDRAFVASTFYGAVAAKSSFEYAVRLIRPDGEMRHVVVRGVPQTDDDGALHCMFGAMVDVTDQKRQEQLLLAEAAAQAASRAKSRFLTSMSHELRTPLHGILGYAQLLRLEGALNPDQARRVDAMLQAGRHLLDLINGVLDLSQIEESRIEVAIGDVNLADLGAVCIDVLRPMAEDKGLRLALVDRADPRRRQVRADPTRLRQVLLNLLGNAIKFTSTGGVELRIEPAPDAAMCRIAVVDTGPGIPPDRRAELFAEFERLGADSAVEGAGLGLAISARLITMMQGRIGYAENPAGTGSVFWLDLPAASDMGVRSIEPVAPVRPVVTPAQKLRVLVVDDVAINRDIASSFLRVAGHDVACVADGELAVQTAHNESFDVILMDVRMPGMDGLEATRRIRALDGPRGRVPIVALTAQAFAEQVETCNQAGMVGHVAKPFEPAVLLQTVVAAAASSAAAAGTAAAGATLRPSQPQAPIEDWRWAPLVDWAGLDALQAVMPREKLRTLATAFVGQVRRAVPAMLDAARPPEGLDQAALADLDRAAHDLKGMAGNLCARRLQAVAGAIERAIRHEQLPHIPGLVEALAHTGEDTEQAMEQYFALGTAGLEAR